MCCCLSIQKDYLWLFNIICSCEAAMAGAENGWSVYNTLFYRQQSSIHVLFWAVCRHTYSSTICRHNGYVKSHFSKTKSNKTQDEDGSDNNGDDKAHCRVPNAGQVGVVSSCTIWP